MNNLVLKFLGVVEPTDVAELSEYDSTCQQISACLRHRVRLGQLLVPAEQASEDELLVTAEHANEVLDEVGKHLLNAYNRLCFLGLIGLSVSQDDVRAAISSCRMWLYLLYDMVLSFIMLGSASGLEDKLRDFKRRVRAANMGLRIGQRPRFGHSNAGGVRSAFKAMAVICCAVGITPAQSLEEFADTVSEYTRVEALLSAVCEEHEAEAGPWTPAEAIGVTEEHVMTIQGGLFLLNLASIFGGALEFHDSWIIRNPEASNEMLVWPGARLAVMIRELAGSCVDERPTVAANKWWNSLQNADYAFGGLGKLTLQLKNQYPDFPDGAVPVVFTREANYLRVAFPALQLTERTL